MSYWRPAPAWNISLGAVNSIRYRLTDLFPENGDHSGRRHLTFPRLHQPCPSPRLALMPRQAMVSMPPEETLPRRVRSTRPSTRTGCSMKRDYTNLFEGSHDWRPHLPDRPGNLLVTKRITEDIHRHQRRQDTPQRVGADASTATLPTVILSAACSSMPATLFRTTVHRFRGGGYQLQWQQLPGIPSEMAQATLLWQPTKSWMLELQLQRGKQYIDDANSVVNDAYLLTGISHRAPSPPHGRQSEKLRGNQQPSTAVTHPCSRSTRWPSATMSPATTPACPAIFTPASAGRSNQPVSSIFSRLRLRQRRRRFYGTHPACIEEACVPHSTIRPPSSHRWHCIHDLGERVRDDHHGTLLLMASRPA